MYHSINYNIATFSAEPSVCGIFPQTEGMVSEYDEDGPDSVFNMLAYEIPDFIPNIESIKLADKAILTDIICAPFPSGGFLVSTRLKQLFDSYELGISAYFKAKLVNENQNIENYYCLQFGQTLESSGIINFQENSLRLVPGYVWSDGDPIDTNINDFGSFYSWLKLRVNQYLDYKFEFGGSLICNSIKGSPADFFYSHIIGDFLVSDRLKEALGVNEMTGLKYRDKVELKFVL